MYLFDVARDVSYQFLVASRPLTRDVWPVDEAGDLQGLVSLPVAVAHAEEDAEPDQNENYGASNSEARNAGGGFVPKRRGGCGVGLHADDRRVNEGGAAEGRGGCSRSLGPPIQHELAVGQKRLLVHRVARRVRRVVVEHVEVASNTVSGDEETVISPGQD